MPRKSSTPTGETVQSNPQRRALTDSYDGVASSQLVNPPFYLQSTPTGNQCQELSTTPRHEASTLERLRARFGSEGSPSPVYVPQSTIAQRERILFLTCLTPAERLIYYMVWALAELEPFHPLGYHALYESADSLATWTGYKVDTVNAALQKLERVGLVDNRRENPEYARDAEGNVILVQTAKNGKQPKRVGLLKVHPLDFNKLQQIPDVEIAADKRSERNNQAAKERREAGAKAIEQLKEIVHNTPCPNDGEKHMYIAAPCGYNSRRDDTPNNSVQPTSEPQPQVDGIPPLALPEDWDSTPTPNNSGDSLSVCTPNNSGIDNPIPLRGGGLRGTACRTH